MPSDKRARPHPPMGPGARHRPPSMAVPALLQGRQLIRTPAPGTGAADHGRPGTIDQKRYAYPISSSYWRISISTS